MIPPFHIAFPVRDVEEARSFYLGWVHGQQGAMQLEQGACSQCASVGRWLSGCCVLGCRALLGVPLATACHCPYLPHPAPWQAQGAGLQ